MTTKLEVLERTRELIADPKHWIKGALAKQTRRARTTVEPSDPSATCFCLVGAVVRAESELGFTGSEVLSAIEQCVRLLTQSSFLFAAWFNDDRYTHHADVMAVLDCAIEKERSRG